MFFEHPPFLLIIHLFKSKHCESLQIIITSDLFFNNPPIPQDQSPNALEDDFNWDNIQSMMNQAFKRFVQKRIGKNLIVCGLDGDAFNQTITELHYETRKMENRWTMYDVPRLMHFMHPGEENKRYWVDTIRHYNQKKISFFVTSVLARKKVSVPLR